MATTIASLGLMIALANAPLGNSFLTSDNIGDYMGPPDYASEPLPLITAHEMATTVPPRPLAEFLPDEVLPESDLVPDDLEEVELDRPGINVPVASRRPVSASSVTLQELSGTSKYMQTALATPTVDEPPKLRLGSMLIEYPLSALRKAIEGLVIVRFTVETDGKAYGIDVVSGLEPACDAAVVSALQDAWFVPGRSGDREVPAVSQLAVRFKIESGSGLF